MNPYAPGKRTATPVSPTWSFLSSTDTRQSRLCKHSPESACSCQTDQCSVEAIRMDASGASHVRPHKPPVRLSANLPQPSAE